VYSANCGHDSIAIFSVDEPTGTLRSVGWEPSRGKMPRNLAFDPQGENLYAANQDSHAVAVFAVDKTTGRLAPAGPAVKVHSPDNVVFR
jgi:6-phosphogluconolactonase (cycloisomerase 2 family)